MAPLRELYRGHARLRPLVEFALQEGWDVRCAPGGFLTFVKADLPPIHSSATAIVGRTRPSLRSQVCPTAPHKSGTGDRDG